MAYIKHEPQIHKEEREQETKISTMSIHILHTLVSLNIFLKSTLQACTSNVDNVPGGKAITSNY